MNTDGKDQRSSASVITLDEGPFSPPGMNHEDTLIRELFEYTINWAKRFYRIRRDHNMQQINDFVLRALLPNANSLASSYPTLSDQLHEFVVAHLHQGLTLKDLSEHFGYSEKYCSEIFILHMGEPFTIYVKRVRLQTANRLLHNPQKTIASIAEALGFQDQFSFSHFFKKETGLSPRCFRGALHSGSHTGTRT